MSRPIEEVYQFWKNFENFPRFMRHLDSVQVIGETPIALARDRHRPACAWSGRPRRCATTRTSGLRGARSRDPTSQNSGSVRFDRAPGARGTEVRVQLQYTPPAGTLGRSIAWLFGEEPDQQVHEDLHRFKQLMETGEIPLSDGPGLWRAAQPRRGSRTGPKTRGGAAMKANCWHGKKNVQVEQVPDPKILNPRDAIVRITSTAICGSDLHLYNGFVPTMKRGDVLGHEFMGEVVEVGPRRDEPLGRATASSCPSRSRAATARSASARLYSLCENSNPNAWMAEKLWGYSPCGIFGYSHLLGGYAGGQAEYARVPFADVGPLKVPDELTDEQVLFLSDIFPTGYMAAEACGIQPGDIVAVWGCGPVGQFAIKSAYLLGAEKVIAIDRFPYRLRMARRACRRARRSTTRRCDVHEALKEMTGGRGPDHCIDAVGMEGHAPGMRRRLRPRQAGDDARDRPRRSRCARRFSRAAAAARCRSRASTAASSTSSRWAPS